MRPRPRLRIAPAYQLHEIDRPGDVRVDHMTHVVEILVEKGVAETVSGIGQQRLHGPAGSGRP